MRLFEVDIGSARDVLAVIQGRANKDGVTSELPFRTVMGYIDGFDLGISTPEGLKALFNKVDPAGDVVQDVLDDGTIVLKTDTPSQRNDQPIKQGTGPSIDAMASSGAKKLQPDI